MICITIYLILIVKCNVLRSPKIIAYFLVTSRLEKIWVGYEDIRIIVSSTHHKRGYKFYMLVSDQELKCDLQ